MTETKEQTKEDAKLQRRRASLMGKVRNCEDGTAEKLEQMYGLDIAEKLVQKSLSRPADVVRACNIRFMSSRRLIEYLAENNLSDEVVAKATRTTVKEVAASRASVGTESPVQEEPAVKKLKDDAKEKEKRFDQRVDNKDRKKSNSKSELAKLSWEDVAVVPEKVRVESYKELERAAWENFRKSEGIRRKAYCDIYGNPTIGNGHLLFERRERLWENPKQKEKRKAEYINLLCKGQKPTPEEKRVLGAEFDRIVQAVRVGKKGRYGRYNVTMPENLHGLSDTKIKEAFERDFKYHYDKVKKKIKKSGQNSDDFDKLPEALQISAVHMSYAGQIAYLNVSSPGAMYSSVYKYRGDGRKNSYVAKAEIKYNSTEVPDSGRMWVQAKIEAEYHVASRHDQQQDIDLKKIMHQQRSEAGKAVQEQTVTPEAKEPENKTIKVAEKRTEQTQESPTAATENHPKAERTVSAEALYKIFGNSGRS